MTLLELSAASGKSTNNLIQMIRRGKLKATKNPFNRWIVASAEATRVIRQSLGMKENLASDPASPLPTNQKDNLSIPTIEVTEK